MSFNKITIIGRVGKDPELRYTPQSKAVCTFTVAANERKKDASGEFIESTQWFRATFFGKQAETVQKYVVKGSQVYIEGRLSVSEWTDKDGKARFTLEVLGNEVQFIGSRVEGQAPTTQAPQPEFSGSDDDIPF